MFSGLLSKRAPRCFFGMKVGTQSLSPRNPDGICNANLSVPSRVRPSGLRIDCGWCMKASLSLTLAARRDAVCESSLLAFQAGILEIGGVDATCFLSDSCYVTVQLSSRMYRMLSL